MSFFFFSVASGRCSRPPDRYADRSAKLFNGGRDRGLDERRRERRRGREVITLVAPAEMTAATALALVATGEELRHRTSHRAVISGRLVMDGGESMIAVVALAAEAAPVVVLEAVARVATAIGAEAAAEAAGVEVSVAAAEVAVAIDVAAAAGAVAGVGVVETAVAA